MKNFTRNLFFNILGRFTLAITVYSISLIVIGSLVIDVSERLDSYRIFKFVNENRSFLGEITWIIGIFSILAWYWIKTIRYIVIVAEASNSLINSNEEPIHFPAALKQMENQMNNIRLDMFRKEQIAKEAEQRKNDLVVYLAHDLKTPLTSVIGYLTLLRDEGQISEDLRKNIFPFP